MELVRVAEGADAREILLGFEERSERILEPGFVEGEWRRFAEEYVDGYLRSFAPGSWTLTGKVLNKLTRGRIWRLLTSARRLLAERNYVECEAHRELFLEGLRELSVGK